VSGSEIDLRFGRWQDVLADVECDALIVDAPYSERTHAGHDEGSAATRRVRSEDERRMRVDKRTGAQYAVGVNRRRALAYAPWEAEDVVSFVAAWTARTRGWFVSITDHLLAPVWTTALEAAGRYCFSPIAFVAPGSRVRLSGDGPAQWSTWIVVARPRELPYSKWGALPGAYVLPPLHAVARGAAVVGGKPEWLMRALIRDYSRAGDLICDPCAGGGTTLLAAAIEGRRAVGAECLEAHYAIAKKRLARGYTPTFGFDDVGEGA
jgi:DNA methylase